MRRVTGPDGRCWRVGRRWLPWRPRTRHIDLTDIPLDGFDGGLIVGIVVAVVGLLALILLTFGLVAIVFAVEWLVAIVVALLVAGWRILARRPWIVYARASGRVLTARRVATWRESTALIEELARQLERTGHVAREPRPSVTGPGATGPGATGAGAAGAGAAGAGVRGRPSQDRRER